MGVANRPALLEVPLYMQSAMVPDDYRPVRPAVARIVDRNRIRQLPKILSEGRRIAILAGNGTLLSGATDEVKAFAHKYAIPVMTTLRAKGAIPEDDDLSLGVFGMGGSQQADIAMLGPPDTQSAVEIAQAEIAKAELAQADTVLLLGATLNENNSFMSDRIKRIPNLIRVDIDANILDQDKYAELMLVADIKTFFDWLGSHEDRFGEALHASRSTRAAWLKAIRATPYFDPAAGRDATSYPMNPSRVVAELRAAAPKDAVMVVDSGANTYFTGHNWLSYAPNEFYLLSTTGPMGYSISMAIGVKKARPSQPVVVVLGDGDMAMHGMEFATAVRYQVPLVVVILDNLAFGNVYLNVEKYGPAAEALAEIPGRDWAGFARAMGGDGAFVDCYEALRGTFEAAFAADRPCLVDVRVGKNFPTPNTKEPDLPGPPT